MIDNTFWKNKKVFITGHTGFKGSWLSIWLAHIGAYVTGYSLKPPTEPSLYKLADIDSIIQKSIIADIRDIDHLHSALKDSKPEIIFHLAAQPIVRDSYKNPVETYAINVMGTVNLLESVRKTEGIRAVVNITTDKCYENKEWYWGYRENEPMNGYDPYSNSKSCSELVTSSFRNSFFNNEKYSEHGVALASARAGNVIGGGDWANDRLIPDCIKSLLNKENVRIRNPFAVRPWQHVLEPLAGYIILAQKLFEKGPEFAEGWNFGPDDNDAKPVEYIVKKICSLWGENAAYEIDKGNHPHEANYLKLDCSKAKMRLGWHPVWDINTALEKIIEWFYNYKSSVNIHDVCLKQIMKYNGKVCIT